MYSGDTFAEILLVRPDQDHVLTSTTSAKIGKTAIWWVICKARGGETP